ncbi:hypothetical protein [Roseomonas xinghualingensis]|uniref:hypothetical protein n=1 Tax=Roseomonas xinghualingensis TaxID=2986475 RepID=UPI0021F0A417|nr:hypothetical protein [Roseomonas sp. SXEYE001]MCV4209352.1 hypothetical protein [Roseomonas sp. SXEYE001]
MARQHIAWAALSALIVGVPYGAASLVFTEQHEERLLDVADLIIQQLDAVEAPFTDLEPDEDDDGLDEASLQPAVLCPDVNRPIRRMTGGRT